MQKNTSDLQQLHLRRAVTEDTRLLWEWTNDPYTRSHFFNVSSIPWETHIAWFSSKLGNPDCIIYIAENQHKTPIGQIRFEKIDQITWLVSTSISKDHRGMGMGSLLIQLGTLQFFSETDALIAYAPIKPENHISAKSFAKAGYVLRGINEDNKNSPYMLYEIKRTD